MSYCGSYYGGLVAVAGDVIASTDWAVTVVGEAMDRSAATHCAVEDMDSLASTKLRL